MNLGIDASRIFSATRVVDAEMLLNIVDGLTRLHPDWRFFLFHPARTECHPMLASGVKSCDERLRKHANIYLAPLANSADGETWLHVRLPLALRTNDIHVAYFPWRELPPTVVVPTVGHAEIHQTLQLPSRGIAPDDTKRRATVVKWIVPSRQVASRLMPNVTSEKDRIAVVRPAAAPAVVASNAFPALARFQKPVLLHIAENTATANMGRVIRALSRLPRQKVEQVSWLFVGDVCDELGRTIAESRLRALFGDVRVLPIMNWQMLQACIAHSAGLVHIPTSDATGQIPLTALQYNKPTLLAEELSIAIAEMSDQSFICDASDVDSIARHLSPLIDRAVQKAACPTNSHAAQQPSFADYCQQISQVLRAARRTPIRTARKPHLTPNKWHFLGHDPAFR